MADVMLLDQKLAQAATLWPLGAELIKRLDVFFAECRPLMERLPEHERVLTALRARALPYSESDRAADHRKTRERLVAINRAQARLAELSRKVKRPARRAEYKELLQRRAAEKQELEQRITWRFPGEEGTYLAFRCSVLSELVTKLKKFADPRSGEPGELNRRRERSVELVQRTLVDARELWRRCSERVADSELYVNLDLEPQEGLIPIGRDPRSGL